MKRLPHLPARETAKLPLSPDQARPELGQGLDSSASTASPNETSAAGKALVIDFYEIDRAAGTPDWLRDTRKERSNVSNRKASRRAELTPDGQATVADTGAVKVDGSTNSSEQPREPLKPTLYLTGPRDGLPSLEDLVALSRALTGREATPEEIEEARKLLETTLE